MPRTSTLLLILLLCLWVSSVSAEVEVTVTGLPKKLLSGVAEAIVPPQILQNPGPINQLWLERYLKKIPQKIREILEPSGYFHAEISSTQELQGDKVLLRVQVVPGPEVKLVERRIELLPSSSVSPEIPAEHFPLKTGDRLREDRYEMGKVELISKVQEQGFLDAQYTRHELLIDRELNQARIFLKIDAGEQMHFGAVTFTGAESYPQRFLQRYLEIKQGEVYSFRLLNRTQKNLRNSDLFVQALVVPQRDERQGGEIPVEIELKPKKRYSLRPGIGYGTDTGARVVLRYKDTNVWEKGHSFSLDLQEAESMQDYTGKYWFPGYRNLNTGVNVSGGYRAEQVDSDDKYIFAEVEQTYGFSHGRIGAIFLRAQYEKSYVTEDSLYTGFLMPGLRFTKVKIPEARDTDFGFHVKGEVRGSASEFFSDISLVQLLGDGDFLLPLPHRMSITLRAQAAATFISDPFIEIPTSLRFFAGGDRSVRGYSYQSLGSKDDIGDVAGGKNLLTGSIELGRTIGKQWGLALFVDSGNAFDSWDKPSLKTGAGVGFRYATPIGPVRVDLASPVGQGELSVRLHVGVGFGW